jgi:hypothetical protein
VGVTRELTGSPVDGLRMMTPEVGVGGRMGAGRPGGNSDVRDTGNGFEKASLSRPKKVKIQKRSRK